MSEISFKRSLAIKVALLAGTVGLVLAIGWPVPQHPGRVFDEGSSDRARLSESSPVRHAPPPGHEDGREFQVTRLELNQATLEQLQTLPGIGEVLARRVIERRRAAGSFRSVDELREVRGIGAKRVEQLRPLVTVGRASSKSGTDLE